VLALASATLGIARTKGQFQRRRDLGIGQRAQSLQTSPLQGQGERGRLGSLLKNASLAQFAIEKAAKLRVYAFIFKRHKDFQQAAESIHSFDPFCFFRLIFSNCSKYPSG